MTSGSKVVSYYSTMSSFILRKDNLRVPGQNRPVHSCTVLLLSHLTQGLEEELSNTLIAQGGDDVEVLKVKRGLGRPG